jgi:hypothetical protein
VLSQLLTLFTTPVIYLWFDRLGQRLGWGRAIEDDESGLAPVGREGHRHDRAWLCSLALWGEGWGEGLAAWMGRCCLLRC